MPGLILDILLYERMVIDTHRETQSISMVTLAQALDETLDNFNTCRKSVGEDKICIKF